MGKSQKTLTRQGFSVRIPSDKPFGLSEMKAFSAETINENKGRA
jgi:hypothetical protein